MWGWRPEGATSKDEIYVATDIEADGPSPGQYSMLSFASAAFRLNGEMLGTFERNLELLPCAKQYAQAMKFWKSQPEAWAACRQNIQSPHKAMREYIVWIKSLAGIPVFVAHPVGFDFPPALALGVDDPHTRFGKGVKIGNDLVGMCPGKPIKVVTDDCFHVLVLLDVSNHLVEAWPLQTTLPTANTGIIIPANDLIAVLLCQR